MDVFVNVKTRLEARCFCDLKSAADKRTNLCVSEGEFFLLHDFSLLLYKRF